MPTIAASANAQPPATANTPPEASEEAKQAILKLKNNLQNEKDICIKNCTITDCRGLQYTERDNTNSIPSIRIQRINDLLKRSLLTIVKQNNETNSDNDLTKGNNLEELFKNLLYSFIEELIKDIYSITDINDIKKYVSNINKHTTITDQNYTYGVMLVKKYIDSYYSNGIAILNDNDVKYYKLTEDKYKEYDYSNKYGKLNNFFILRIIDKKIMIHQIYQQIIYALIDTITKNNEIFKRYYNLQKTLQ